MSNSAAKNPKRDAVNFSHRLGGSGAPEKDDFDIVDSVGLISERALGVLRLLLAQFDGSDNDRISDRVICGAIDSVIKEVEDIDAIIIAFNRSEYPKDQAQKNPEL